MIAAGAAVTGALFRRAFPEASIEFRSTGSRRARSAEKFLRAAAATSRARRFAGRIRRRGRAEGVPRAGARPRSARAVSTAARRRSGGGGCAGSAPASRRRSASRSLRWATCRVPVGPARRTRPAPRLTREEARAVAARVSSPRAACPSRPRADRGHARSRARTAPTGTSWTRRRACKLAEATVRYATTVSGDRVTAFQEYVHVPGGLDAGLRAAALEERGGGRRSRPSGSSSRSSRCSPCSSRKIVRKDVPVAARRRLRRHRVRALAPLDLQRDPPDALRLRHGEPALGVPDQGDHPRHPRRGRHGRRHRARRRRGRADLPGALSRAALACRRLLAARASRRRASSRASLLGYALAAFFFAYQAVFYVVAARFGAWAPADVPYSDMLNTALPWATVLLIGFLPAVSEEGISRMFSISFLDRLGAGRLAGRRGAGLHLGVRPLDVPEPALLHPRARGGLGRRR